MTDSTAILAYLSPQTDSARIVVAIIQGGFAIWCIAWLRVLILKRNWLKEAGRLNNGSRLRSITTDSELVNYLNENYVLQTSPVHDILQNLFQIGRDEMRVEALELVRARVDALARTGSSLRNVVGLFLIIGLFGTLIGLAEGLAAVSSVSNGAGQLGEAAVAAGVHRMLLGLYGGFAPSLWGISATVICTFLSIVLSTSVSQRVEEKIETMALVTWIPSLVPTLTAKALAETGGMIRENQKLIEEGTHQLEETSLSAREFQETITESISLAKEWTTLSRRLQKALDPFVSASENLALELHELRDSIDTIKSFDKQLRMIYSQLLDEGQQFRANTEKPIREYLGILQEQSRVIGQSLESNSETLKRLTELQQDIRSFVDGVKKEVQGIDARTLEELNAVGKRIADQMVTVRQDIANHHLEERNLLALATSDLVKWAQTASEVLEKRLPQVIDRQSQTADILDNASTNLRDAAKEIQSAFTTAATSLKVAIEGQVQHRGEVLTQKPRSIFHKLLGWRK